jgi:hypothetical protein
MKKFLLSLFVLVVFAGCGGVKPIVDFRDKSGILSSKIVNSETLHFSYIDVNRYKLQDENNSILFYEKLIIDNDYNFKYNPLNSIIYIFNAKKAIVIYDDTISLLVQLELDDGEFLNVFANSAGVNEFSYVYGFSNYEFKKIAKEITKDSNTRLPSLTRQGVGFNIKSMPLSRWNLTKLIVTPFVYNVKGRILF